MSPTKGAPRGALLAGAVGLVLLLSACINPLGGGSDSSGGGATTAPQSSPTGSLTVSLGGIGASTVSPGAGALAANTAYYSILLEDPAANFGDISDTNVPSGAFPYTFPGVPATTWDLTVRAHNAEDEVIGSSPVTPVTITGSGASVNLALS
ncbi:MAG: hypothetical protein ACOCWS_06060, partial [Alkalispirochaetaceae bacterium]